MRSHFSLPYFVLGIVGSLVIFAAALHLVTPRKMPKKAYEIKKPTNTLAKSTCVRTYGILGQVRKPFVLPILLYHYVEEVQDPHDIIRHRMNISPPVFKVHLDRIKDDGFTTVFVSEIPEIIQGKKTECYPAVALTFDDGYEDFYEYVFPLLKQYKLKATVYVIADFIGKKGFLSDSQIRELLASGLVEVGSHTLDHLNLTELTPSQAENEIYQSKRRLEIKYDIQVKTFSYPFGKYVMAHEDMVKGASYSAAVTVHQGAEYTQNDLLVLPRVRPESLDLNLFIKHFIPADN